ncbi:MAG: transglycosylase family protein [Solirubrobacterales bacterium]|nr:transglycosylase family protein [Solirubrobacterales bacterium]
MNRCRRRHMRLRAATGVVLAGCIVAALGQIGPASAASLGQLNTQLGAQQARQQSLSGSVSGLSSLISSLDGQIAIVQSREAAVRAELAHDQAALASTQASLHRERALLVVLRARLARARMLLSRQLLSSYEKDKPDLVGVVLNANGFDDLLEKLGFLRDAERQQQAVIAITKQAKAQADVATQRLTTLEATDRQITADASTRVSAVTGMESLLQSKQGALQQARAAQQSALAASRDQGAQLQSEISRVQSQQAAAERSANSGGASPSTASSSPTHNSPPSPPPSVTPAPAGASTGGGWAIPGSIVQCESGGQNLTPNPAGASGYYQIIPSTWKAFGGSGSAAYQASRAEQNSIASRIYNGGSGVSAWQCAGMVGIH